MISTIEAAADQTIRGNMELVDADEMADAGELVLRQLISMRKLRDHG